MIDFDLEPGVRCACQNCDWEGPAHLLGPIADLGERVSPGEPVPAGECPDCGCLAHLSEPDSEAQEAREALAALMVWVVQKEGGPAFVAHARPGGAWHNAREVLAGAGLLESTLAQFPEPARRHVRDNDRADEEAGALDAVEALLLWAAEVDHGHAYTARMQKPVAVAKAKAALRAGGRLESVISRMPAGAGLTMGEAGEVAAVDLSLVDLGGVDSPGPGLEYECADCGLVVDEGGTGLCPQCGTYDQFYIVEPEEAESQSTGEGAAGTVSA